MNRKIENLTKAIGSLERAISLPIVEQRDLAGIIKSFEFSYELAWVALKAFLLVQGQDSQGPRDVIKKAWQLNIPAINDEEIWLKMIVDRNLTVHTYDEIFAREMVERIRLLYWPALAKLLDFLSHNLENA